MNERKFKHKGDTMKRLVALVVAAVFCVTLFSPIISACAWDPATGPQWVDRAYVERATPSGDGGGFDPPVESSQPPEGITSITYFTFWFQKHLGATFIGFFIDTSVTMGTDNNAQEDGNNTRRNQGTNPR